VQEKCRKIKFTQNAFWLSDIKNQVRARRELNLTHVLRIIFVKATCMHGFYYPIANALFGQINPDGSAHKIIAKYLMALKLTG
jgi:hypothetical protein